MNMNSVTIKSNAPETEEPVPPVIQEEVSKRSEIPSFQFESTEENIPTIDLDMSIIIPVYQENPVFLR